MLSISKPKWLPNSHFLEPQEELTAAFILSLIEYPGNKITKMNDCELTKIINAIFILPSNNRAIYQIILMNQYGLLDLLIHLRFHKVHFFTWHFCHGVVIETNLIPKVMEDFEDFCRSILGCIFWMKCYNRVLGL